MADNLVRNRFDGALSFTITLTGLATSVTLGLGAVGRQSTLIANASPSKMNCKIIAEIVQGINPTGSKQAVLYYLKGDGHGTPYFTDGAGVSDAGITLFKANILDSQGNKAAPSTGEIIGFETTIIGVDKLFGVAVAHNTGVNLGAGSFIHYDLYTPEIQ